MERRKRHFFTSKLKKKSKRSIENMGLIKIQNAIQIHKV